MQANNRTIDLQPADFKSID